MGRIVIASPPLGDAATLTAGSAIGSLPVSNLQRQQPGDVWASTEVAGAFVTADLGQAETINLAALLHTNGGASATWRVRGATSEANLTAAPGYDSGSLSVWPVAGLDDWPAVHAILWLGATPQTFQWWRLDLADATNPDGRVQAGRLFLSNAWQPSRNRQREAPFGFVDPSIKRRATGGQLYPTPRRPWRVAEFNLAFLSEDEMFANAFELDRLRGTSRDVLVLRDPDDLAQRQRQTVHGLFQELSPIVDPGHEVYEKRFLIEEML